MSTSPATPDKKPNEDVDSSPHQNFVLSKREAKAASPEALAVCGEEDPGEGLEFLVTDIDKETAVKK
ncbi:MAG: hypothetical protein EOP48_10765 [Sphingobacteriales bacterium]|nr:MAG: hypothetical protein EOP48_10765 [Sphingobacteriales bacterium]